MEMSFRSQASKRDPRSTLQLSDLVEGAKVDGVVKKIEDYGLFIEIEGSKLRGLCHKSEVLHCCRETFFKLTFVGSSLTIRRPTCLWLFEASEKGTVSRSRSFR